jgi:Zinc knuckle/Retrotransposon gag protein
MAMPAKGSAEYSEWRSINSLLHTWLLNLMVVSIAKTIDGIEAVSDVWGKLMRIYAEIDNNMKVFQIEKKIEEVTQKGRSVQEYAVNLQRLWAEYDHFSPPESCMDPNCKKGVRDVQKRTLHFLRHLDSTFDQKSAMLLAQSKIPSLDEAISAMIQEESCIGLQAGSGGLSGPKSALAAANTSNTRYRGETRQCYNCGEVGHLKQVCPKPPKERCRWKGAVWESW